MGSIGNSNYLSGIMLILVGWKAQPSVQVMLSVIPVAYFAGVSDFRVNSAPYAVSQAALGIVPMIVIYLNICVISFNTGIIMTKN